MKYSPFLRRTVPLSLLLLVLGCGTVSVQAAGPPPTKNSPEVPSDPKDMKEIKAPVADKSETPVAVRLGLPLWSSAISGNVGVVGREASIGKISFSNLYHHLDYVIPGSIAVDYGKWGVLLEGQYVKLSDNLGTRDILFESGALEMDQAFADFNISYKVVDTEKLTLAPFIGTRFEYVRLHTTLNSRFPALISNIDSSHSEMWADPILGLQVRYQLFKPVAFIAKADVGGFGAASELTYQALGGIRTQITRHFYTSLDYRYLYTDYKNGGFTYNLTFYGPQITCGVNF